MYIDIIIKKENNQSLTKEELKKIFNGYLNNEVSDEEMTRFLKAICNHSLSQEETIYLTDIFINSGDNLNLDSLGVVVDKHSTGGVGDKLTLIVGPIVASLGIKMAKMSGRSLGHTGGTIDKLESIFGFNVNLTKDEFINQVKTINIAITSQTDNMVPMDKKVYALRDVTNTTESIPLIASSIMSKKIACGASKILIDIKMGDGALVKNLSDAKTLANLMIKIGRSYNKEVVCMITDMSMPLGTCIGNGLEVVEALEVLRNGGDQRLRDLAIHMASLLVCITTKKTINEANMMVLETLEKGKAYRKFCEMVGSQKGDINNIKISDKKVGIYAKKAGTLVGIKTKELGTLVGNLGASRKHKDDQINHGVGVILNKKIGSFVKEKELLCTVFYENDFDKDAFANCFDIAKNRVEEIPLIYEIIN